jgi:hypothetical protein
LLVVFFEQNAVPGETPEKENNWAQKKKYRKKPMASVEGKWEQLQNLLGRNGPFEGPDFSPDFDKV